MKTPSALQWIETQHDSMIHLLKVWSQINSHSNNLEGLALMLNAVEVEFKKLGGKIRRVDLPPRSSIDDKGNEIYIPSGQALHIIKRAETAFKILCVGHLDTVFPIDHPFQNVAMLEDNRMRGPGVADMKGGLIVMLKALEAFEKDPTSKNIGWEIVINPDEEVGSFGSEKLIIEAAQRTHVGLVFEPSFADGAIVSSRKGSANLTVVAKGKSAHAGRDFSKGRNAIVALAAFISKVQDLNDPSRGITLNVGRILGGGPVNIVPDLAICRINVRIENSGDFDIIWKALHEYIKHNAIEGTTLALHLDQARPPKPLDEQSQQLFQKLQECAKEENLYLITRPSGGVCDGNLMAEQGLAVIDSLGVIGGELHTSDEYMELASLTSRARLVASLLLKLAKEQENDSK